MKISSGFVQVICHTAAVSVLVILALPASAQWNVTPDTLKILDGVGPEGLDTNCLVVADNFDGVNNTPDLRGTDGLCGTVDDDELHFWKAGGGSGIPGCFNNAVANCVGDTGGKSAEWDFWQVLPENQPRCTVTSFLKNTSDGEAACPNRGCINTWSSPKLPMFQAAVAAAILAGGPMSPPNGIPPGTTVSAVDGPGGLGPCLIKPMNYTMGWNPTTPAEPGLLPETPLQGPLDGFSGTLFVDEGEVE